MVKDAGRPLWREEIPRRPDSSGRRVSLPSTHPLAQNRTRPFQDRAGGLQQVCQGGLVSAPLGLHYLLGRGGAGRILMRGVASQELLGDDVAGAAVDAVAGPGGGAQHVDVGHGRAVARLAGQRAEKIALRQVVRAAVGVARPLVGAEAGEVPRADHVAP